MSFWWNKNCFSPSTQHCLKVSRLLSRLLDRGGYVGLINKTSRWYICRADVLSCLGTSHNSSITPFLCYSSTYLPTASPPPTPSGGLRFRIVVKRQRQRLSTSWALCFHVSVSVSRLPSGDMAFWNVSNKPYKLLKVREEKHLNPPKL